MSDDGFALAGRLCGNKNCRKFIEESVYQSFGSVKAGHPARCKCGNEGDWLPLYKRFKPLYRQLPSTLGY